VDGKKIGLYGLRKQCCNVTKRCFKVKSKKNCSTHTNSCHYVGKYQQKIPKGKCSFKKKFQNIVKKDIVVIGLNIVLEKNVKLKVKHVNYQVIQFVK